MQDTKQHILTKATAYSAVAFDVFGTLLNRDVAEPTDLFYFMEKTGMVGTGFAEKRVKAEAMAREKAVGEITLQDIYAQPLLSGVDEAAECAAELNFVTANLPVYNAAKLCSERGKKIYAISDMYLPKQVIWQMLDKCGYDFLEDVIVSSEYGIQKRSGKLFSAFLIERNYTNKDVIFFGDDFRADVCGAAMAKICAYCVAGPRALPYMPKPTGMEEGALYAFIQNRINAYESAEALGYGVLGPLLVSFAIWLHDVAATNQKLFLARDMYLVEKIYRTLYPDEMECSYLKVSRRSLLPALFHGPMDDAALGLFADGLPRQILRVDEIMAYCGFAATTLKGYAAEDTVDLKSRPLQRRTTEFLRTLSAHSKYPTEAGVLLRGKLALRYLQQQVQDGGTLIDIGSGGTTQRLIEALGFSGITGCYLACDERLRAYYSDKKGKVFLFGGTKAPLEYWAGQPMLEKLISEPCGATIGYKEENDTIIAVTEQEKGGNKEESLTEIQRGVLEFAKDWKQGLLGIVPIKASTAIAPFLVLQRRPNRKTVNLLGSLVVEDGGLYPLIKASAYSAYMLHPRKIKLDFLKSRWKSGFMKQLLKLPLPYWAVYAAMKGHATK